MSFILIVTPTTEGKHTAELFNRQGIKVAYLAQPMNSAEEILSAARQFRDENPDLFKNNDLVTVDAEYEKENHELFEPGGLIPSSEIRNV